MKLNVINGNSVRRWFVLLCWLVCIGVALPALTAAKASTSKNPPQAIGIANFPRIGLETLAINQLLDEDAASGAGFARISMEWVNIEPDLMDPSEFSWEYYDWLYAQLAARGLTPLVRVQKCPPWACNDPNGPILDHSYNAFGQFMSAVAARYSQPPYNVHFYEFWNEPDGAGGANNQFGWGTHPDKYVQMLSKAYASVKAADPQSVVIMGGMAYDFWFQDGGPFNPDFLAGVLDNGGAQYLDAIAFHYYTNNIHGWANIGMKTDAVRAVMNAHGANLPIVSTEGGLTSASEYGGSEAIQARYVVQMIVQGSASGLSGITWFIDRDLANPVPGLEIHAKSGLLRIDNSIKPAYTAMQTFSAKIGSGDYLYRMGAADGVAGTLEGYRFRSKNGNKQVSVVWNTSGSDVTMTIPATQAGDLGAATSLLGSNLLISPGPDGTRLITVGLDPVYLEWNSLFSDVPNGSTFYPYVMCLVGNGVLTGYSDGTFRPSNNITRGQIAKVVSNAAGFTEPISTQTFEDVPPGSTFYDFIG
ncbi:MAG: S-layer homology domain-containing protein, partial [Chloroflexia bacterium]